MATILIRTVLIYFIFLFSMRILGKRQIGELELSEFVTTLMLSELAVNSIQDISIPISYSLIPMLILLSFEVILSFAAIKSKKVRKTLFGTPTIIIKEGRIDQKQIARLRISINELLGELRLKDCFDIRDVDCAIIEQNGKLSVCLKTSKQPLCKEDQVKQIINTSPHFSVITDGEINQNGLTILGKNEMWLRAYLKGSKIDMKRVYLMTMNKTEDINIIYKEEK